MSTKIDFSQNLIKETSPDVLLHVLDGGQSMNTPGVRRNIDRLKAAARAGKIRELNLVWSPADTTNDTRYRVVDNNGESQVLLHNQVAGFLTGLEKAR